MAQSDLPNPQPTSRRDFLKIAVGAAVLAAPLRAVVSTFVRAPYVQNVSPKGASILWTLSSQADAVLQITDASGAVQNVTPQVTEFTAAQTGLPASFFQYQASLANLTPDTAYAYSIQSGGQALASPVAGPLTFSTPGGDSAFTFLAFADSGVGSPAQLQLASLMDQENAGLVLANGDLAYELGSFANIESNYFGVYSDLMARVPFFTSLGNHEYLTDSGYPSLAGRVLPQSGSPTANSGRYYSFDWGDVHFVALDSNAPLASATTGDSSMLTWLDNDLRATRKFWRVVFFHHPGYATGVHQFEPPAGQVRQYIVPILETYGVQLVLNGHEHNYQRTFPLLAGQPTGPASGGITYITAGGGGQGTYLSAAAAWIVQILSVNHYLRAQVSGAAMTISAVTVDGSVVDSVQLAPLPRLSQVLESAAFSPRLASGGMASIFGSNLSVAGVLPSVTLGGNPVPVLYSDASQINIQIPFTFSGSGTLAVQAPNGPASFAVMVAQVAPAIFVTPDGGVRQSNAVPPGLAVAEHGDGSLVLPNSPAEAGETITLLLTGLGAVNGAVQPGVAPAAPLPVAAGVTVSIGGVSATVISAGLGTANPGVYEVRVVVPAGVTASAPVQVSAGGVQSNTALLATA
jgi:acid phosphatase type 7